MLRTIGTLLLISLPVTYGALQSYGVEGKIYCNDRPASGIVIHLVDEDTFSPDDLMADGETGSEGSFRLSGSTTEIGTINPELHIYHRCDDPRGQRFDCPALIKIPLPRQLVTQGQFPKNVYHVDTLHLKYDPKATRKCYE